jgi:hypothetical protein
MTALERLCAPKGADTKGHTGSEYEYCYNEDSLKR